MCYRRYHEMEGLMAMTHYEYQSKIACAWLDHTYFDNVQTGMPETQSLSSLSTANTSNTQKRTRFCDRSLDPLKGALKQRMNHLLPHWSKTSTNPQHYCQLCYWATSTHKYRNVVLCKQCNVVLCTDGCCERFHTVWDLVGEKSVIAADYEANITSN